MGNLSTKGNDGGGSKNSEKSGSYAAAEVDDIWLTLTGEDLHDMKAS
jgi:hypothetical protein